MRPFLQRLFNDPEVLQIRWSPLRKFVAWSIARSRAPFSRDAYAQIGGRSPILAETTAQAQAVADVLAARGIASVPVVAMAAWHPLADEALAALAARGVERAIALPLYPQESRTTTDSSLSQIEAARARHAGLGDRRRPTVPRRRRLPARRRRADRGRRRAHCRPSTRRRRRCSSRRTACPRTTSARAIPTSTTSASPSRRSRGGWGSARAPASASRARSDASAGSAPPPRRCSTSWPRRATRAVVVVPIAFTGEHIETLQEIDILYRERAEKAGIIHFARARTVGTHPAFIAALADLAEAAARERGWI